MRNGRRSKWAPYRYSISTIRRCPICRPVSTSLRVELTYTCPAGLELNYTAAPRRCFRIAGLVTLIFKTSNGFASAVLFALEKQMKNLCRNSWGVLGRSYSMWRLSAACPCLILPKMRLWGAADRDDPLSDRGQRLGVFDRWPVPAGRIHRSKAHGAIARPLCSWGVSAFGAVMFGAVLGAGPWPKDLVSTRANIDGGASRP